MHQAEIIVVLLSFVVAVVVAAQKLNQPYPIVLVLAGLAVSFVPGLPAIKLSPDIFFFYLLPALLYPAALFTSWRDFRRNLRPILLLAIGLVLATMVVVASVAHAILPALPWASAFALGAIVSPPDAIAATSVIRRLSVPYRLEAILEGESLVNDATALVALQFAVAAALTGKFSVTAAAGRFVLVALGGVAFGLVVGFVMRWVQRRLDDPPVQITLSLLTPFLAYLPAERLHVSGVLATVTAGIYLGWHSPLILTPRFRLQAFAFWQMAVFLLNGFVFVTIGLQLPGILRDLRGHSFGALIDEAALISSAVVLVRIGWVFVATYLPRLFSKKLREQEAAPSGQVAIIAWAGMRGAISLAAAFALPLTLADGRAFPGRNYLLFLTFAVILTTLVFQGLTLPFLIRKLGVKDDGITDEEERSARIAANSAALGYIDAVAGGEGRPNDVVSRLHAEYDDRMRELEACCAATGNPSGEVATPQYQQLQQEALKIERETIIDLRNRHVINDEALRRIQRDLDLAEARLTGF